MIYCVSNQSFRKILYRQLFEFKVPGQLSSRTLSPKQILSNPELRLDNLKEGDAYKETFRSKNGEDKERKELEETTICLKGNTLIE